MSITIRKADGLCKAVTPPHGEGVRWVSPRAMSRDESVEALRERGCHQADIGDAFYEADPDWVADT